MYEHMIVKNIGKYVLSKDDKKKLKICFKENNYFFKKLLEEINLSKK
jgi:hypothetical protein